MDLEKKCPVCRKSGSVSLKDERLCLCTCSSCTHTFSALPPKKQETYEEKYFEEEHENWFRHQNYGLYDFVFARLSGMLEGKKIKLLDVGCGKGDFLRHIRKKDSNAELWGIDLAENSHPKIHFIKGDFFKKKLLEKKFNAVCNFAVAEHIENPDLFAKKMNNALEQGGFAAIMTIDNNSLLYRIARILNKAGISVAYNRVYSRHHLQHYSKQSLRLAMEKNGFKTLLQKSHNGPLKAIDVPKSNFFSEKAYRAAVAAIFSLAAATGTGMYQTIICKKVSEA